MKVLLVFGTRPEAIKMAPIVKEFQRRGPAVVSQICVTGQHRQMLDQALALFGIEPDFDLRVMQDAQTPTHVAAAVLERLEPILRREKPDWVFVQGDTTTAAAAALAAFYSRVKVAHVEAGLRTFDRYQPFPEEVNRRIAAVAADLHFAPTERARRNLLREGVPGSQVSVTGNTVIDALHWVAKLPTPPETLALIHRLLPALGDSSPPAALAKGALGLPAALPDPPVRLILVTAHRRENFGQPLEQICLALRDLAQSYGSRLKIIYPVHLNPNVQEPANRILGEIAGVILTPPLDYLPLVHVMKHATLVLTDSGGIQEEAPGLGKPVLVLRDVTERPEAVEAGTARLVGADRARIVKWTRRLLDNPDEYAKMAQAVNPFGDGNAARRIVDTLLPPRR